MDMANRQEALKDAGKMIKIVEWQIQRVDKISQETWILRKDLQDTINIIESISAKIYERIEGTDGTA